MLSQVLEDHILEDGDSNNSNKSNQSEEEDLNGHYSNPYLSKNGNKNTVGESHLPQPRFTSDIKIGMKDDIQSNAIDHSKFNYKSPYNKLPPLKIHRRKIPSVKYKQKPLDKSYEVELVKPSLQVPAQANMVDYSLEESRMDIISKGDFNPASEVKIEFKGIRKKDGADYNTIVREKDFNLSQMKVLARCTGIGTISYIGITFGLIVARVTLSGLGKLAQFLIMSIVCLLCVPLPLYDFMRREEDIFLEKPNFELDVRTINSRVEGEISGQEQRKNEYKGFGNQP